MQTVNIHHTLYIDNQKKKLKLKILQCEEGIANNEKKC